MTFVKESIHISLHEMIRNHDNVIWIIFQLSLTIYAIHKTLGLYNIKGIKI